MTKTYALITMGFFALSIGSARGDQFTTLGTSASYAVLGASTVTNTGSTVISGNLGVFPGTAIVGFLPGLVNNGVIYAGTAPAGLAKADALTAYNNLAGLAATQTLTGEDMGGLILTPGTYFYASSAQLTGAVTLNFEGLNNADIILQIGSTLTTASDSSVTVINKGLDDNVYWQVGSSATLGTSTVFEGDILAYASVTVNTGVTIPCGSVIALTGAVTLDSDTISNCSTTNSDIGDPTSHGGTGGKGGGSVAPEPESLWLVGTGLFGGLGILRRRKS